VCVDLIIVVPLAKGHSFSQPHSLQNNDSFQNSFPVKETNSQLLELRKSRTETFPNSERLIALGTLIARCWPLLDLALLTFVFRVLIPAASCCLRWQQRLLRV
jgi:hypothetical protein